MATRNDITGDKIQSKPTQIGAEHWESIFGPSAWDKYMKDKKIDEEKEKEIKKQLKDNEELAYRG